MSLPDLCLEGPAGRHQAVLDQPRPAKVGSGGHKNGHNVSPRPQEGDEAADQRNVGDRKVVSVLGVTLFAGVCLLAAFAPWWASGLALLIWAVVAGVGESTLRTHRSRDASRVRHRIARPTRQRQSRMMFGPPPGLLSLRGVERQLEAQCSAETLHHRLGTRSSDPVGFRLR